MLEVLCRPVWFSHCNSWDEVRLPLEVPLRSLCCCWQHRAWHTVVGTLITGLACRGEWLPWWTWESLAQLFYFESRIEAATGQCFSDSRGSGHAKAHVQAKPQS